MLTKAGFAEHLGENELWPTEGRVLVGYSGGADSACLIDLLAALGKGFIAAYLHHGMRPEADKEAELCTAFCESLNVQFVSGRADVPAIAREQKVGLEEAGRIARYTFLREAANKLGCVRIATAHTRTDHVETVLLHVIRGSGRRGLGGIAAMSGDLIRPLLPYDRGETRTYCNEHGLWFYDDPANEDPKFARSRLRNEIVPALREINPGINPAIARLATVMREEDIFLDGAAAAALERLEIALNGQLGFLTREVEIGLDLPHFRHLPLALIRRAVRLCFETLGAELDFEQTETVVDGIQTHSKGAVTAEGGEVVGEWTPTELAVRRLLPEPEFEFEALIPGRIEEPELGWSMEITEEPNNGQVSERSSLIAYIDRDLVGSSVCVRPFRPGDRIQPLGFDGTRKLSDILAEAGLTINARRRLPIFGDNTGPIWVPGTTLDDRFRVKTATKQVLKLAIDPAQTQ